MQRILLILSVGSVRHREATCCAGPLAAASLSRPQSHVTGAHSHGRVQGDSRTREQQTSAFGEAQGSDCRRELQVGAERWGVPAVPLLDDGS